MLTRGSPELRQRVLSPLASLPFNVDVPTLITALKWLFALGLFGRINSWLNKLALNNWKFSDGGKAWDMPNEVAAITGGSGGIGSEVIKKLAPTGMKIAIMDLQPPSGELKGCMYFSFASQLMKNALLTTSFQNRFECAFLRM